MSHRLADGRGRAVRVALLGAASTAAVAPLGLALLASLTPSDAFMTRGLGANTWTLSNYAAVLADPDLILRPAGTTAAAVLVLASLQTTSSILAAYVFAVARGRIARGLFAVFLAMWLVPPVLVVIPWYVGFASVGLAGTFSALVLPTLLASPYAVLLLRQWFTGLPTDLLDAARLDGAGHGMILRRIVLPLSAPAVTAVVLVTAVTTWNSYLWPRLVAGVRLPQIQVAVGALRSRDDTDWPVVLAASMLALLPVIAAVLVLHRPLLRTFPTTTEG